MRAILVAVDYTDLLAVTLPYNRHHFDEVMVVTDPKTSWGEQFQQIISGNRANTYITDSFYRGGADFNKWLALEEGLDRFGREGWICLMDADILWPKKLPKMDLSIGSLYTPLCRIKPDFSPPLPPPEADWGRFNLRPNQKEWAGYSQIFHADDPHLPTPPWHQINWRHAGGADSFFQRNWPADCKIRPPFEALHLGPHGRNWAGRVTDYLNGSVDPKADGRRRSLNRYMQVRRKTKRYDHERLT